MSRVPHPAPIFMLGSLLVVSLWPRDAVAFVLSDREEDRIIFPGQPSYGLNLDGVGALGADSPNSSEIDGMLIYLCTGSLLSHRLLLTATHCLDTNNDDATFHLWC